MKIRSLLLRALFIAVTIHIGIVTAIIVSRYDFSKKDRSTKKPRLTISFMNPYLDISLKRPLLGSPLSPSQPKDLESNPKKTAVPEAKNKLQDVKPKPIVQEASSSLEPRVPMGKVAGLIKRYYGDIYFELSSGEQEYIIDNLQKIRRINHPIANALLEQKPQDRIVDKDNNYVEFYLYPDGTVSDITLINEREGALVDELIVETIEHAYSQYPRPKQKTLIRLRSWIIQVQED